MALVSTHLVASLSIAATLALSAPQAKGQVLDNSLWVPDHEVSAVVSSGNKIYIGGNFNFIGPLTGGGVPIDLATGSPVATFPRVEGRVFAAIPDGAGGWYIGGRFASLGGVARANLAHVLADGSVDQWNPNPTGSNSPGGDSEVAALALSGSSVYVGGDFTTIGGKPRVGLAAVHAATGEATAWSPDNLADVYTIALSGNTVYVGGDNFLAAWDDATTAPLWRRTLGGGWINTVAVGGDVVYVGGYFFSIGGQSRTNIASVDATTGSPSPWNPNAGDVVWALALSGGTVYVGGGWNLSIGAAMRGGIAAVDATTGIATAWNPDAKGGIVYSLAVSGNTVFAGGDFNRIGGQDRAHLAALDAATGLASQWDPVANAPVHSLAFGGTTVYVGGGFTSVGAQRRNRIAQLDAETGSLTPWNPGANGGVADIAVVGNTVYACGYFTQIAGRDRRYLAALDATTGMATPWVPDALDGPVSTVAASSTTVYVGSSPLDLGFTSIGGQARNNIGALNAVTGAVAAWDPNPPISPYGTYIHALAVNGSTVYVAGGFTSIGGLVRNNIASLDATTGAALPWNPDANGWVRALSLSGNTVFAGGEFTSIGGQGRNKVAALEATTGNATEWNPSAYGDVRAIALSGNTVYVASPFLLGVGGHARAGIAAIDATSGSVRPWNPGVEEHGERALAVGGGRIYVGGGFYGIDGQERQFLAAFVEDTPTPTLVAAAHAQGFPDRIELAWELGGTVGSSVTVQRSGVSGEWRTLQTATVDGSRRVLLTDRNVEPGRRYDYRIGFYVDGIEVFAGEVWAEVPAFAFSLRGSSPNPSAGRLAALFTLPVNAPASLELMDVTGRRITEREVGSMGVGAHSAELTPDRPLPAGLYWLRLTQEGKALTTKLAVVR